MMSTAPVAWNVEDHSHFYAEQISESLINLCWYGWNKFQPLYRFKCKWFGHLSLTKQTAADVLDSIVLYAQRMPADTTSWRVCGCTAQPSITCSKIPLRVLDRPDAISFDYRSQNSQDGEEFGFAHAQTNFSLGLPSSPVSRPESKAPYCM